MGFDWREVREIDVKKLKAERRTGLNTEKERILLSESNEEGKKK